MRLLISADAADRIAELCRMSGIDEKDFLATGGHGVGHHSSGTLTLKHAGSGASIVLGRYEWALDPEGGPDEFIDVPPGDILLDESGARRLAASVSGMARNPRIKWSPATNRVIILIQEHEGASRQLDVLPGEWRPSTKHLRGH